MDKTTGVRSDHTVILTAIDSAKAYPEQLRRVTYLDVETRKRFKFLTNNFTLPALTIAQIYKCRWQVELFFSVDQNAPTDQGLLRHQRERGEDPNLYRLYRNRLLLRFASCSGAIAPASWPFQSIDAKV